jgi:hypothetical protein
MKTEMHLLYYIGVKFGETFPESFYICYDNSVRVGDRVVVTAYNGEEKTVTVVSALYCTADDTPVPLEQTKCVIRKVLPDCGTANSTQSVNSVSPVMNSVPTATAFNNSSFGTYYDSDESDYDSDGYDDFGSDDLDDFDDMDFDSDELNDIDELVYTGDEYLEQKTPAEDENSLRKLQDEIESLRFIFGPDFCPPLIPFSLPSDFRKPKDKNKK